MPLGEEGVQQQQVFVKTLSGATIAVDCDARDVMGSVQRRIEERLGVAPQHQRLVLGGKQIDDVNICDITQHCTLHLELRLLGGKVCVES